jgi:hypothetical protein
MITVASESRLECRIIQVGFLEFVLSFSSDGISRIKYTQYYRLNNIMTLISFFDGSIVFRWIKRFLIMLLVMGGALGLYWGKCQLGINFFSGISWEQSIPFLEKLQKKPKVFHPARGDIFVESFDRWFPLVSWNDVWSRDQGMATVIFGETGRNGTRGIVVENLSSRDWAMYHNYIMDVNPGDEFVFSGWLRSEGSAFGQLSLILYDVNGDVLNWGLGAMKVDRPEWTLVESRVMVPFLRTVSVFVFN